MMGSSGVDSWNDETPTTPRSRRRKPVSFNAGLRGCALALLFASALVAAAIIYLACKAIF